MTAEEAVEEPQAAEAPPAPEPEPQPDAVIVVREVVNGSIQTSISTLGTIQPDQVETLLGLGLKRWREQLGLA